MEYCYKSSGILLTKKESLKIRCTGLYKYHWRVEVLNRDNWKCTNCRSTSKLEVHHIKSVRSYPEFALDINNGITLCRKCHKETMMGLWYKYQEELGTSLKKKREHARNYYYQKKGVPIP